MLDAITAIRQQIEQNHASNRSVYTPALRRDNLQETHDT
jgi:hypothetical protein